MKIRGEITPKLFLNKELAEIEITPEELARQLSHQDLKYLTKYFNNGYECGKPKWNECSCEKPQEISAYDFTCVNCGKWIGEFGRTGGKPIPELRKIYNENVIFMCEKHKRVNCNECFEVLPKVRYKPEPKECEHKSFGIDRDKIWRCRICGKELDNPSPAKIETLFWEGICLAKKTDCQFYIKDIRDKINEIINQLNVR